MLNQYISKVKVGRISIRKIYKMSVAIRGLNMLQTEKYMLQIIHCN